MNHFVNLSLTVLSGYFVGLVESDGLIAINAASSVQKLFKQIKNENAPSPDSDRACVDASIRQRICKDITHSGYFPKKHMHPVRMAPHTLLLKLNDDKMFSRIYTKTYSSDAGYGTSSSNVSFSRLKFLLSSRKSAVTLNLSYEYRNLFTPRKFRVRDFDGKIMSFLEHVFVCFLEDDRDGDVHAYYVSKEYNVVGVPFGAGRFIFTERGDRSDARFVTEMLLAEEPADVFVDGGNLDYNVEVKYLERRHDRPLTRDNESDPVCRLLSKFGPDNQEDRLCALVMSSSYFRRTAIEYPEPWYIGECSEIKVSFQTMKAREIVGERTYWERAVRCHCRNSVRNDGYDYFYISRAYAPNEVFVYKHDGANRGIFLENLFINVGIVGED